MQPFRFNKIDVEAIWGVEEWILSCVKGRESTLVTPYNGCVTLSELIQKYKETIVGKKIYARHREEFPLLVKVIKTNQQLSVQVHPSDEKAQKISTQFGEEAKGKNEMWYILETKDNAKIIGGFNDGVDNKKFTESFQETNRDKNNITELLKSFDTKSGDYFFTPAGLVHSIGEGITLLEIQQPSQTTYRLYDYDRVDGRGNKRKLDIDKALESVDLNLKMVQKNVFEGYVAKVNLLNSQYFKVNFINLDKICRAKCGKENFYHLDLSQQDSFFIIMLQKVRGKFLIL